MWSLVYFSLVCRILKFLYIISGPYTVPEIQHKTMTTYKNPITHTATSMLHTNIFIYVPPVSVNSPMASGWVYFWSHVTLHKCLLQILENINTTLTTELRCFYSLACIQLLFTSLQVVSVIMNMLSLK